MAGTIPPLFGAGAGNADPDKQRLGTLASLTGAQTGNKQVQMLGSILPLLMRGKGTQAGAGAFAPPPIAQRPDPRI